MEAHEAFRNKYEKLIQNTMAKGNTIGFLNFGIDGDNREFLKKIDQIKKESVSIEQIFKNIKLNTGGKVISSDVQKAQIAADKLAISNNKVIKSAAEMALAETKSANQVLKDTQKLIYEKERLAGLRKRNALIGVQGQKDLAAAYGLTNKTMFNQKNLLQQLSSAAGIYLSIYQAGAFIKELATVSGEFEKQRVTLTAIIGDAAAANRIFNQIKDLAVISPFNFKELTDYAKQLSAFSIPTNEIYDTTKRLADLSAGLGVDMSRIILAYGQVRSAAVLRGQELRQFTEAGIPLVDELAKKFGELSGEVVTAGEVFDKISNREVPFAMVKEIIEDLTNEGGKFYRMQETQSETLAGKISNLRDNYDMMLDSLGKANKGLLHGAVDGLVAVMDNWEKYWKILKEIIVIYGTYKAAIFVIAQGTALAAKAQKLYNTYLLMSSISGSKFGSIIDMISGKFESLDKVTKRTLAAGVIAAIFGIGYAIKTAYDESHKLEKSLSENFSKIKGSADASVLSLDNMLIRLKNATAYSTEWNNIIKQINKSYGEYLPLLLKESDTYDEIEKKLKGVSTAIYEKAKSQSYANSINIIEENLSKELSEAYDMAFKSLTEKPSLGFDQVVLSKKEANEVINKAFAAIKESPELYKEQYEVQKLISSILSDAFKGRKVDTSVTGLLNYTQLNGLFDGIYRQAKALNKSNEAVDYAIAKNKTISGQNDNYKKQIDQIAQKYAALAKEIDKTPLTNGFNIDEAKANNTINMLDEMLEVYKQFGQYDLARDTERQIETVKNGAGWRKELQDILGKTITINTESNIGGVVDEIKKKYKELTQTAKDQADILKNNHFNFDTNSFNFPANNAITQIAEAYKANKTELDSLGKALAFLGISIASVLGDGSSGNGKDEFAEKLKKRIELLKDVHSEYDKLVKSGKNSDDAATYLMGLDSFKGIDPRNYEQDIEKIIDDLKKKGKLSEQQRSILESLVLGKDKDEIAKEAERIIKESKSAFDKIEKELSQYKDQYSLYEYIFGKTGDKSQAMKIAFGDIEGQVKSNRDALVAAIEKTTDPENKKKLEEDLAKLDLAETSSLAKKMADLIAKYQTTEEKITSIRAQYSEKRKKMANSEFDPLFKDKSIEALTRDENDQIDKLKEELWQLTPFYKELFGDLTDISFSHLKRICDQAKKTIDLISGAKNENGELTYGKYNDGKLEGYYMPDLETGKKTDVVIKLKEYERIMKKIIELQKRMRADNPFQSLIRDKKEYTDMTDTEIMASKMEDLNAIIQDIAADLSNMFDALGNEDAAEMMQFLAEMSESAINISSGLASNNPVQVIQGMIGSITSLANHHDNKLNKSIKKSQALVKQLSNEYNKLERTIARQLGAVTDQQAKDMIKNQRKQIIQLEYQRAQEESKKKKDKSVIADLDRQIDEAKEKLRYFYEDLAGEQWGIKIQDWSEQISSALIDAFASGEDAAEAFDKSVADIMKNVIKNMISISVIKPAMEDLRLTLFGNNGKSGLLGGGKTDLTKEKAGVIITELEKLKGKIVDAQSIWDYLNNVAEGAGMSLTDTTSKSTLTKAEQSLTENTGNIIASYMNAMRSDLSEQKRFIQRLVDYAQLNTGVFENMYAELMRVQVNTLATANNTARNTELVSEIRLLLQRATTTGSGTKFNI